MLRCRWTATACRVLAGFALLGAPAAWAQSLPNGTTLPPGVTPESLRGMSPAEARARYDSLDPATKRSLHEAADQAKAQYGNDPGLKETLKAMLKSWKGQ
jgi:hypothetical protein